MQLAGSSHARAGQPYQRERAFPPSFVPYVLSLSRWGKICCRVARSAGKGAQAAVVADCGRGVSGRRLCTCDLDMATSEASLSVPCSLCEATFANPRELGTHILTAHCGGENSNGGAPAAKKAKLKKKIRPATTTQPTISLPQPTTAIPPPPPAMVRAMMVPPPPTWVTLPTPEFTPVPAAVKAIVAPVLSAPSAAAASRSGPAAAAQRPQNPSDEERRQKFMTIRLSEFSSKYICLVCNKAYTSRYNIRMHCNMHTGKNVHRCK